jgi:ATP-binding cassette, subfamily B, bacterial MsbA
MFRSYWQIVRQAHVPFVAAFLSCILILLSSLFQLLGLGLVVPVLNGLVDETSFKGIRTAPVLGRIISTLPFEHSNTNIFLFMVALIFGAVVCENLLLYGGRCLISSFGEKLVVSVRTNVFMRLVDLSRRYFDARTPSAVNYLIVHCLNSLQVITQNLANILIYTFLGIVYLALMFTISWQLTLAALVLLPITYLFSRFIMRKIYSSSSKEMAEVLNFSNKVDEVFGNISLVQLENQEQSESSQFKKLALAAGQHGHAVRARSFLVPSVVDVLNAFGALLIISLSVLLFVTYNSFSLGRLLVFFVALRRFTSTAQQISSIWMCLVAEQPRLAEISEVLFTDHPKISSGNLPAPKLKQSVHFNNVSFSYQDRTPILTNLSFEVPAHTITALVGPTGGGKSTIVQLLPRFYELDSGRILFDGTDIRDFDLASLRSRIALVSQREMLFNFSIRENICYGLDAVNPEDYHRALEQAQLLGTIASLPEGDETLIGSHGSRLSGGEKQRIQIARAILKNPDILILDEPTSALDAQTEAEFEKALSVILPGRTVFVIAHRIKTVQSAQKILFIEAGKIVESGSYQELQAANGRFAEYCRLQNLK